MHHVQVAAAIPNHHKLATGDEVSDCRKAFGRQSVDVLRQAGHYSPRVAAVAMEVADVQPLPDKPSSLLQQYVLVRSDDRSPQVGQGDMVEVRDSVKHRREDPLGHPWPKRAGQ